MSYNKQKTFEDFKEGQAFKYKGKIWMVCDVFHDRKYIGLEYDPYLDPSLENVEDEEYDLFREYWKDILNKEEKE